MHVPKPQVSRASASLSDCNAAVKCQLSPLFGGWGDSKNFQLQDGCKTAVGHFRAWLSRLDYKITISAADEITTG